jgi:hypothetical protein
MVSQNLKQVLNEKKCNHKIIEPSLSENKWLLRDLVANSLKILKLINLERIFNDRKFLKV